MRLPKNVHITAFVSFIIAACLFFLLFGGVFVGAIAGTSAFVVGVDPYVSFLGAEGVGILMFLVGLAVIVFLWWYLKVRRK